MLNRSHKVTRRLALGITALSLATPAFMAVAQQNTAPSPNALTNTQWELVVPYWNLGERARLKAPTLRFDAGRVGASVGCNSMSGSYTLQGDTIQVGAFISTRMACGAPLDTYENRYAKALGSATKWQLSKDGKVLLIQTAKEPLVFTKRIIPPTLKR